MRLQLTLVTALAAMLSLNYAAIAAESPAPGKDFASTTVTPEKRALIMDLLTITDADKKVDQIVKAMMDAHARQYPLIAAQVINSDPSISDAQKKQLTDKMQENSQRSAERMKELFLEKINMGDVMNQVALTVYDKNFTDGELKDIIGFYKTKTGKKSLQVMPQVMQESMEMTSQIIAPKMQGIIEQLLKEERARLKTPDKPAG